jgi:hypothetical protein
MAKGLSTYALKYRPPGFATCPKGWVLLERGTGGFFPNRQDLPAGEHRFGVIGYERCLTPAELESFEIVPAIVSY